jgi:hypothetical protein
VTDNLLAIYTFEDRQPPAREYDSFTDLVLELRPPAREQLRSVLIRDQADRDAISSRLMRYRDGRGDDWADIIDMLTMYPEARRKVVRAIGEIEAAEGD